MPDRSPFLLYVPSQLTNLVYIEGNIYDTQPSLVDLEMTLTINFDPLTHFQSYNATHKDHENFKRL